MITQSSKILGALGYDYYTFKEPGEVPERVDLKFKDILAELSLPSLNDEYLKTMAEKRLFKHQLEALRKLSQGYNVILRSGTGSGKTEAWLFYAIKNVKRTLAIYPTLALANDQLQRLKRYSEILGLNVVAIDAKRKEELYKRLGSRVKLRRLIAQANIVITNPAFLLNELKKMGLYPEKSILSVFLREVDLIVLDEFDFYGPREIAILFSMIRVLRDLVSSNFQLALLTATLENANEVAKLFSQINSRPSAVIEGKAFKVKNFVYVVLGKDLCSLWKHIRTAFEEYSRVRGEELAPDVLEALEDFEKFRRDVFKILSVAEGLGLDVPRLELDPVEILQNYLNDEGVTLVFTRSIARAEEICRRLKLRLPLQLQERVAVHHHLISKTLREQIEEGARKGRVKVLFSPRTLSQGIDIGTIVRVVHIGLPDNVREYWQREGRKGRREEIEFSETIVIPSTRWDRDLLSRGVETFRKWIKLPLEKTIVNPNNKYSYLFEALFKFISPMLRDKLSEDEYNFLRELGLVSGAELTRRGKDVWRKMNFYEFSPPYGIKRIKMTKEGEQYYLEEISHCDLVERFQPGCIDYTSDGIVVLHNTGGRSGRVVTAVMEEPLGEGTLWRYGPLAEAYEEYAKIKRSWKEEPNIFRDYAYGRIHSEVICVVYPPKGGFGRLVKIPNRVIWFLRGPKPIVKTLARKTIVFRDLKAIEVPTITNGRYTDYTYGRTIELDPAENPMIMRIGLAYLMVVLRKVYGIPFETIMYSLHKIGEKKLLILHEPESAGLLESLDWLGVSKAIREYNAEELDEILMLEVDENAYLDFVSLDLNWNLAKEAALRVVEYLLLQEKIMLSLKGRKVYVPRPSRALKLATFDVIELPFSEELKVSFFALGVFDGEEVTLSTGFKEFLIVSAESEDFERSIRNLINKGFRVMVFSKDSVYENLTKIGLKSFIATLKGLEHMESIIELSSLIKKQLNLELAPLEELEKALGLERKVSLSDVLREYSNSLRRIKEVPVGKWQKFTQYLGRTLREYLEESLKNMYLIYLLLLSEEDTSGAQQ